MKDSFNLIALQSESDPINQSTCGKNAKSAACFFVENSVEFFEPRKQKNLVWFQVLHSHFIGTLNTAFIKTC